MIGSLQMYDLQEAVSLTSNLDNSFGGASAADKADRPGSSMSDLKHKLEVEHELQEPVSLTGNVDPLEVVPAPQARQPSREPSQPILQPAASLEARLASVTGRMDNRILETPPLRLPGQPFSQVRHPVFTDSGMRLTDAQAFTVLFGASRSPICIAVLLLASSIQTDHAYPCSSESSLDQAVLVCKLHSGTRTFSFGTRTLQSAAEQCIPNDVIVKNSSQWSVLTQDS